MLGGRLGKRGMGGGGCMVKVRMGYFCIVIVEVGNWVGRGMRAIGLYLTTSFIRLKVIYNCNL